MLATLLLIVLSTELNRVRQVDVVSKTTQAVTIEWQKVDRAKSYHVRVLQKQGGDWQQIKVLTGIKKRTRKIKQLDPATRYRLQVRAVRGSTRGSWSKALTVKTKAEAEEELVDEECVSNTAPVFTADMTDLTAVADIVPPPSLSGTVLKTHSFLNTQLNLVPVYAPIDADLTAGAYYLETNPDGEYVLRFQASCEVTFMFDHITDPVDDIRAVFPDEPKDNTQDDTPTADIHVAAGDLIGYTTGTMYGIWDFGVYNSTVSNDLVGDEQATERDTNAVCPYDYYSGSQRSAYYALFARTDERDYPGVEDFCQAEEW